MSESNNHKTPMKNADMLFKCPKVLYVDDNEDSLCIFSMLFKKWFDITLASSASKALEILQNNNMDVVVTDYEMPEMNGLELLKTIKASYPHIPVVFYTGQGNESIAREAFLSGVDDYFIKEVKSIAHKEKLVNSIQKSIERKNKEEALKESQHKYRQLIQSINDGILILDKNNAITFVNERFCRMMGCNWKKLLGVNYLQLVADECLSIAQEQLEKFIRNECEAYELIWEGFQNQKITTITSPLPLLDSQGNFLNTLLIVTDITKLKLADENLKSAGIGLYRYNYQGVIQQIDRQTIKIFGLEDVYPNVSDVVNKKISDLIKFINPVNIPKEDAVKSGRIHNYAFSFRTLSGEHKWALQDSYLVRDTDTGEESLQSMIRDITQSKLAEERINHLNRVLKAIRNVNQLIIHETDSHKMAQKACNALTLDRGYKSAWIVLLDKNQKFQSVLVSGLGECFKPLAESLKDNQFPTFMMEALSKSSIIKTKSLENVDCYDICNDQLDVIAARRLEHNSKVYGVLVVSLPKEAVEDEEEAALFEEVAGDIAYALHNIEVKQEHKAADSKLKKSEARMQAILDNSNALIYVKDLQGRYILVNKRFEELFKFSQLDVEGKTDFEILKPNDAAIVTNNDKRVIEMGFPIEFDEIVGQEDGVRHYMSIKSPIKNELGEIYAVCGISTDISDRKSYENALWESRQMLKLILDSIPVRVFWKDKNSTFLGCNKVFAADAGLESPDMIKGKNDYDMPWEKEESDFFREWDRWIMDNDIPQYHIVESQSQAGGNLAWLDTNKIPLHNTMGEVIGILGTYEDITPKKIADDALRDSEAKYRAIVESFDGLIYICSQNYEVEFMNDKFKERTGYDAVGEKCYKALHELDDICPWCVNDRVFKGETVKWEVKSPKDNRWYYVVNTPIFHSDGSISKQALIMDVTDKKAAEESLKDSQNKYRVILDNLLDVIWTVDFKSRLTFISESLEKILGYTPEELMKEEGRAWLDKIHPDDKEKWNNAFNSMLHSSDPIYVEFRMQNNEKEWINVFCRTFSFYENKGIKYIVGIMNKIDEDKCKKEDEIYSFTKRNIVM